MKTIGAFQAKTYLSSLLKEVATGNTIQITHRGVPVAHLIPASGAPRPDLQKVSDELRAARKGKTLNRGANTLRKLSHEGHRH